MTKFVLKSIDFYEPRKCTHMHIQSILSFFFLFWRTDCTNKWYYICETRIKTNTWTTKKFFLYLFWGKKMSLFIWMYFFFLFTFNIAVNVVINQFKLWRSHFNWIFNQSILFQLHSKCLILTKIFKSIEWIWINLLNCCGNIVAFPFKSYKFVWLFGWGCRFDYWI